MAKEAFKTIHGNEFGTPNWLFDSLNNEFNFEYDLACTEENKKCEKGICTPEFDSLEIDWHKLTKGFMWCNPPYSPLKPWILKAQQEFVKGAKIVMLIPAIVSPRYFSQVTPSEIRFILGRVPFVKNGVEMKGNMQDSMIVVYDKPAITKISYVERDSFKQIRNKSETIL